MSFFNEILWLFGARSVIKSAEEEALRQQQEELQRSNQELDNIEEEIRQIRELVKQSEKSQQRPRINLNKLRKIYKR